MIDIQPLFQDKWLTRHVDERSVVIVTEEFLTDHKQNRTLNAARTHNFVFLTGNISPLRPLVLPLYNGGNIIEVTVTESDHLGLSEVDFLAGWSWSRVLLEMDIQVSRYECTKVWSKTISSKNCRQHDVTASSDISQMVQPIKSNQRSLVPQMVQSIRSNQRSISNGAAVQIRVVSQMNILN